MDELIKCATHTLEDAPEGTLRIAHNHNTAQYYWRSKHTDSKGKYIRRSEQELARQLAQKDYARKIVPMAVKSRNKLQNLIKESDLEKIVNFHKEFSIDRQALINPYLLSDDEYASLWMEKGSAELCGVPRYPLNEETGIITENGELVRSKSEKILADKLYLMKIPYIYEKPLLVGAQVIYPDFTILNKCIRKEIYWEHFGMMDNPEYCEKAVKKINAYHNHQIYEGSQLILTFETSTQPLNIRSIEGMIQGLHLG